MTEIAKKLNEQIVQETIKTGEVYRSYGHYALLYKRMPICDEGLEDYISKLNRLQKAKVQVSSILDYRLLPESTLHFKNNFLHSSKGVFLEQKARGVSFFETQHVSLSSEEDIHTQDILRYITLLTSYVAELENRASTSQKIYDKLVRDFLMIEKENLTGNPKPGHVFFDSEMGYTFVAVLPKQQRRGQDTISKDVFDAVFGCGMPKLQMDNKLLNLMPFELQKRMAYVLNVLQIKITLALRKNGFPKEEIRRARQKKLSAFKIDIATNYDEMETYLSELQAEIRKGKEKIRISSYIFK